MRPFLAACLLASTLVSAQAGEGVDILLDALAQGTAAEGLTALEPLVAEDDAEALFGAGALNLVIGLEGFAQDVSRHGGGFDDGGFFALFLGLGVGAEPESAPGAAEPLDYAGFRAMLERLSERLDTAHDLFVRAGEAGEFSIPVDLFEIRLRIDPEGEALPVGEHVTQLLGLIDALDPYDDLGVGTEMPQDLVVGFDTADAFWFAGYTRVVTAQTEFILAHDFEQLFEVGFHRFFTGAGQAFAVEPRPEPDPELVELGSDADFETAIADFVAMLASLDLEVTDSARLAGVLDRLRDVTVLSRRNWEAILLETDDFRELVPSPSQTSIVPEMTVTKSTVDAWFDTLDTVDAILAGELLVPHWRFVRGFDLVRYFETATRTDVLMIATGYGALPYLADGPVADETAFGPAIEEFGDDVFAFMLWFN